MATNTNDFRKICLEQEESYEESLSGAPSICKTWNILTDRGCTYDRLRSHPQLQALLSGTNAGSFFPSVLPYQMLPQSLKLNRICDVAPDKEQWKAKITYSTTRSEPRPANPCDVPTTCAFVDQPVDLPAVFDAFGKPYVNTACDFMEGNSRTGYERVYTVCKNYCEEPEWTCFYDGVVNSDFVYMRGKVWDPGTLLLSGISSSELKFENQFAFYEYCWQVTGRAWGWYRVVPNRGYNEKKYLTKLGQEVDKDDPALAVVKKCRIFDDFDEPIQEPAFLDECGRSIPVAPGQLIGTITTSGDSFTSSFDMSDNYLGTTLVIKRRNYNFFATISTVTSPTTGTYSGTNTLPDDTYDVCASGITTQIFNDHFAFPFVGIVPGCCEPIGLILYSIGTPFINVLGGANPAWVGSEITFGSHTARIVSVSGNSLFLDSLPSGLPDGQYQACLEIN